MAKIRTFLIADTHFGHKNILDYCQRPYGSLEEMHKALIFNWNATVKPKDKVYCLGDMAIARYGIKFFGECNGRKILIKGNHDIFKLKDYLPYFDDIRAYHVLDRFFLSHVPIHPKSLQRWKANIHGHLHNNVVMDGDKPDPRYFCVSVERIGFTPLDFEHIRKHYKEIHSE